MQSDCTTHPTVSFAGGVAYIYVANQKLHETKEPSFLFDHHTSTCLRYGDRAAMEEACEGMRASYRKYEMNANELEVLVFPAASTSIELLQGFFKEPRSLADWVCRNRQLAA